MSERGERGEAAFARAPRAGGHLDRWRAWLGHAAWHKTHAWDSPVRNRLMSSIALAGRARGGWLDAKELCVRRGDTSSAL